MDTPPRRDGSNRKVIRLTGPADLIALVPYLLGFHPSRSVVVVAFDDRGALLGTMRMNLPDAPHDAPEFAHQLRSVLTRNRAGHVAMVGYGPGHEVTPLVDASRRAIDSAGLKIMDVLRVDGGRYWSYHCTSLECCPPEGVPYDSMISQAAASAVMAGYAAYPDRAALEATLRPVDGPERDVVKVATRKARARAERLLAGVDGRYWYAEGTAQLTAAFDVTSEGGDLTPEHVAWLGILLTVIPVRDMATARVGDYPEEVNARLWTQLTRRVEPGYVPAPATILAFTAFGAGNGPLSRIAVDRALSIDPEYRLALLVRQALDCGLAPTILREWDLAAMLAATAAQVERTPAAIRPVLPKDR
ncbi:DUF4192 domain-containing protein [Sphaerisporangium sp. TRM90804]|uniref:DUF4192 domain-containing protein n=1 Tax=Sphaerisporangium sp. TRM90804 TaxID=3031113 RepID=UPI00244D23FC|nr:DUF4192 domain-containing protein [Sphaerisporangium sp. TRM90804]MDH2426462.1 DUF4192 domain-containing protein [Sphaerisporangium sp. TRM90804]